MSLINVNEDLLDISNLGGPAVPGLIDYNFIKFRDAVGKVFAVRNRIMQQEAGKLF
jgi:hypothetical protein